MAIFNATTNSVRLDALLRHHCKFNYILQADATGAWLPITAQRICFERGIDDTVANPFNNAGWSEAAVLANSIELTSAFKGGALSDTYECLILAVSILPENNPRVRVVDANNTNAIVQRAGGAVGQPEAAIYDELFSAAMHGCQLSLLPTGTNTGCALFLGIPQLQSPGTSFQNSGLVSMGDGRPSARYVLGDDVIVAPSANQDSLQPNRIQLDFQRNVTSVDFLVNSIPRANLFLCILDLILVVDYARVITQKDASGVVTRIQPVADIDADKIKCFRERV